jgi:sulfide:quinone oxidoreductase
VAAVAADAGEVELADGRRLPAAAVVALPRLRGTRPAGLPHDAEGFVPVDEHGRVAGCDRVFAAGDVTDFPLKQGGLAAQQADAVADAILAAVGYPIVPRPFRPVLRGVLYTDHDPAYLRAPTPGADPEPQSFSLWWPPSKVAGRHLSPYLTMRAGAPRAPEVRPSAGAVEVDVPLAYPVAATRPAFGAEALPPG